jgi:outer membrane protein assembly factor BamB
MGLNMIHLVRVCSCAAMLAIAAFTTSSARGENWPQWRGPAFNGSSNETHLPDHWGKSENITWTTPMPGKTAATPAIWGDSVFVTSPDDKNKLLLLCLNARDGAVRWQKTVADRDRLAAKNNMASPSPVTDGKVVVAMFGTGDLAAFDFAGTELWSRNLARETGKFAIMFYYSSSPLLYHGKLYVQVVQRSQPKTYNHSIDDKPQRESFLMCIDPQTGKDLWRSPLDTDAVGESQEAYTSPLPYEGEHGSEIVVFGGGFILSHHADTGKELWRCGSLNPAHTGAWRTIASPVAAPGLIIACVPRSKSPMFAVKADCTGPTMDSQIAWKYTSFTSDVPTPLYYEGRIFVLDGNKKMMTCLDAKTGDMKWQGALGLKDTISASPTGADGKIYCMGEAGTVVILSAGDEFKILSTFQMEGEGGTASVAPNGVPLPSESPAGAPMMSSIAVANGHLFIRTPLNLYCVGAKE